MLLYEHKAIKEARQMKNHPENQKKKDSQDKAKKTLAITIANNINKILAFMNWRDKDLAGALGFSASAISNYLNPTQDKFRLPTIDILVKLQQIEEFSKKGLSFTIDDLLREDFFPKSSVAENKATDDTYYFEHIDYIGSYLCYFNEQGEIHSYTDQNKRNLRFAVLTIYNETSKTSSNPIRAIATVYKSTDRNKAFSLKNSLDAIFKAYTSTKKLDERNQKLLDLHEAENKGLYVGDLSFSGKCAFVNIESGSYNDKAMIVLYAPPKNNISNYIGGMGVVSSVSHGRAHAPSSQKIIVSKYQLNCSDEEIAKHLNMSISNFSIDNSGEKLAEFCFNVCNKENTVMLDDSDRIAIIKSRLNKIIVDYTSDNLYNATTISEDEDKEIYKLISSNSKQVK